MVRYIWMVLIDVINFPLDPTNMFENCGCNMLITNNPSKIHHSPVSIVVVLLTKNI